MTRERCVLRCYRLLRSPKVEQAVAVGVPLKVPRHIAKRELVLKVGQPWVPWERCVLRCYRPLRSPKARQALSAPALAPVPPSSMSSRLRARLRCCLTQPLNMFAMNCPQLKFRG